MLATLLLILPFAVASALSPMMLTEQTVLLAKDQASARRFALGVFITGFAFVALATLFGKAISLPTEPTLSSSLDIALGVLMILLAGILIWLKRRAGDRPLKPKKKKKRNISRPQAFGFGAFSMATNFTTLALLLPAAKIIAASGIGYLERAPLELVLALMAATPAWLPLALADATPGSRRGLTWIARVIAEHSRGLIGAALVLLGAFLVLRGAIGL